MNSEIAKEEKIMLEIKLAKLLRERINTVLGSENVSLEDTMHMKPVAFSGIGGYTIMAL